MELLQLQEWKSDDEDVDTRLIRARNQEIRQLEEDIVCLNDIFRDLALLVGEQGEQFDIADSQIIAAVENTSEGAESLKQAEEHSIKANAGGWLLKGTLAFSGITVGGIGLTLISPVLGAVTVGAGITGIVSCIGIAISKNK